MCIRVSSIMSWLLFSFRMVSIRASVVLPMSVLVLLAEATFVNARGFEWTVHCLHVIFFQCLEHGSVLFFPSFLSLDPPDDPDDEHAKE